MSTVYIDRFDEGMTNDVYGGSPAQASVVKHFDVLTYPRRLYPIRGMAADTSSTGIGNIIVASDGNFYGMGVSGGSGQVYTRASGAWVAGIGNFGDPVNYNLLIEYHNSSGTKKLIFAGTNQVAELNFALDTVANTNSVSFTNITQGYVHPKDDVLYIGYDNKIMSNNNGTWTNAALTLPASLRVTSLSHFGDYLAIACCPSVSGVDGSGAGKSSVLYLWDRNTSLATVSESVNWGSGLLKLITNLDGVLHGISDTSNSANSLDYDSIVIRAYAGAAPQIIKEIPTNKQTSTAPAAYINTRVNFIYRGRWYFSLHIEGGSTSPSNIGLWSLGRSPLSNRYSLAIERLATIDNSETDVLAAAIDGDICSMCYNAAGTLSITNSGANGGSNWTATSVWESLVNHSMPEADRPHKKKLMSVSATYVALPTTGQVVLRYRVDGGSWTTIFTETSDGSVATERVKTDAGTSFTDGRTYEFRLESTGFAQITGLTYRYQVLPTNQ